MNNPRQVLSESSMTSMQVFIVAIAVGLNALDGFDVLSIGFAMPGIAAEWNVERDTLGFIASMELLGMCLGSLTLGGLADRMGRRSTVLLCLITMSAGMFLVTTASNAYQLCAWRLVTGLGIGGMLAVLIAIVTEFSNARSRYLCVSLYAAGYPVGGLIGGAVVSFLLPINEDWRSIFYFGAAITAAFIPLVYFYIPESIEWLAHKQPVNVLEKINKTLTKIGKQNIDSVPSINAAERKLSIGDIFSQRLMLTTIVLTSAYFLTITAFYFVMKWAPTIAVDMGYSRAQGGSVLTWASGGAVISGIIFGIASLRFNVKYMTICVLLAAAVSVTLVGTNIDSLLALTIVCVMANFFTNAAVVGLYAMFSQAFPTHTRAFGTGFVIGIGRGGALLSPIIVGFLYKHDIGLIMISSIMGAFTLLAAGVLVCLKFTSKNSDPVR